MIKTKTQTNENEIGLTVQQIERLKTLTIEDVEQRQRIHLKKLKSMSNQELVQRILSLERLVGQKNDFLVELRDLVEELHGEYFDAEFNGRLFKESELSDQEHQYVVMTIDDIASTFYEKEE